MSAARSAIEQLESSAETEKVVVDAYLDLPAAGAAERFASSSEFAATMSLLSSRDHEAVLDLGSGSGIASRAFASLVSGPVVAVEPDRDDRVGARACRTLCDDDKVVVVVGTAAHLPVRSGAFDLVYGRQVLHHIEDLAGVMSECHRVLRPGGTALFTREHVADNELELAQFLDSHPIHRLVGGEGAHPLHEYLSSIEGAGFQLEAVIGPWDSVINAYPTVRSDAELRTYPRTALTNRFGRLGSVFAAVPGVSALTWRRLRRPFPGRMYTFLARR